MWCRSQWPLACRDRGFESHRGHGCLSVESVVCCLCDELFTHLEESYRLWEVVVCDLENLKNEAMTRVRSQRHRKKNVNVVIIHTTCLPTLQYYQFYKITTTDSDNLPKQR
jgi:hypothetical protein